MSTIASIAALVIGIILILWTVHILLTILGWALAVAGAIYLLSNLLGGRKSRSDL
jgi:hypothetical protein